MVNGFYLECQVLLGGGCLECYVEKDPEAISKLSRKESCYLLVMSDRDAGSIFSENSAGLDSPQCHS